MKKITLLILLLGSAAYAQNTAIPDPNFEQALIDLGYDIVLDGQVLTDNINDVVELDVFNKSISDLTGIEDFSALEILVASLNNLNSLDISNNINLSKLDLQENLLLSSIDVTENINLEELLFSCPLISNVNVSNNPNLKTFYSRGPNSNLTSVDLTQNPLLETLRIRDNQISELDLSNNPLLFIVECDSNLLSSLTVSNMSNLQFLFCANNSISSIDTSQNPILEWADVMGNQLTTIDISHNPALYNFRCNNNPDLSSLDVRNGNNQGLTLEAINNPALTCLFVDDKTNIPSGWNVDPNATYVETQAECDALDIQDYNRGTFTLYPNPAKDFFIVKSTSKIETVLVYDTLGKLIKSFSNQNQYVISGLLKGLYILHIKGEKGTSVKKLIIE